MPRGKYILNQKGRAALKRSLGGTLPEIKLKIPKKEVVLVPKQFRGIKSQELRERKMVEFIQTLSDAKIDNIIKSHPLLEKTADGETFAQSAYTVKLMRQMPGKKK